MQVPLDATITTTEHLSVSADAEAKMLAQELIQDLDTDFLNIDSFFANNDDAHDGKFIVLWLSTELNGPLIDLECIADLWSTPRHCGSADNDDGDWFAADELDPLVQVPEDVPALQTKQSSPVKCPNPPKVTVHTARTTPSAASHDVVEIKTEPGSGKRKMESEHGDEQEGEEDFDGEEDEGHHCCGYHNASDAATDESVDLLDDDAWLDFDKSPLTSPSMLLRKVSLDKLLPANEHASIKQEEQFLLPDETDYSLPEFTDEEVSALVGSPSPNSSCVGDAVPRSSVLTSPSSFRVSSPLPMASPKVPVAGGASSTNPILVNEQDIPDMVNLFSSMYSPSVANHHVPPPPPPSNGNALSILVPAPQMYATMFPFSTTAASAATFAAASSSANQLDYFTPPGFTNNRYLEGSQMNPSIFLSAEALSPATKGTIFAGAQASAAQSRAQVQAHVHAAAAAALAMANSAAAMHTMRKLNATYGVPIAPLQRSLHPELKPRLAVSSRMSTSTSSSAPKTLLNVAGTSTTTTSSSSASKATKLSITPDIADFKLVQIFHNFCDPATKLITLTRFHQLLQHHQVKEDPNSSSTASTNGANRNSSSDPGAKVVVSQEAQSLFKVLDPAGTGCIDLETFMNSFQICNRCTEAKRRAHTAHCASQGQSFVPTALERQLMEDVSPVIVRVVPTCYEGSKVKSCEHYQWTWCEGFEKTGNEKCRGTNRHDKCPKYLANCTLWKHKLPPKNRKAKVFENQDSPSKKFKHFA